MELPEHLKRRLLQLSMDWRDTGMGDCPDSDDDELARLGLATLTVSRAGCRVRLLPNGLVMKEDMKRQAAKDGASG